MKRTVVLLSVLAFFCLTSAHPALADGSFATLASVLVQCPGVIVSNGGGAGQGLGVASATAGATCTGDDPVVPGE